MPIKVLLALCPNQQPPWHSGLPLREDIQLISTADSHAALDLARTEQPQVAVVDVDLEPEGGLRLCRDLRAYPWLRNLSIILLGDCEDPATEAFQREGLCRRILPKPTAAGVLLDAVIELIAMGNMPLRAPRVPEKLPVRFARTDRLNHTGFSADLSTGGLFLATQTLYTTATLLKLRFLLPGQREAIDCAARVVWVNSTVDVKKPNFPQGMGLQFVDLDVHSNQAVEHFLKRRISPHQSTDVAKEP